MYHLRRLSGWPQVPVLDPETGEPTGETRDADAGELLNRWSLVYLGETEDGDHLFDCGVLDDPPGPRTNQHQERDLPGEKVSEGRHPDSPYYRGRGRFDGLPPEADEVAHHAVVYRARDGSDLRSDLRAELDVPEPESGREAAGRDGPDESPELLEAARERATAPEGEGPAPVERRRVPLREVEDGDVVEVPREPGHGGFA